MFVSIVSYTGYVQILLFIIYFLFVIGGRCVGIC